MSVPWGRVPWETTEASRRLCDVKAMEALSFNSLGTPFSDKRCNPRTRPFTFLPSRVCSAFPCCTAALIPPDYSSPTKAEQNILLWLTWRRDLLLLCWPRLQCSANLLNPFVVKPFNPDLENWLQLHFCGWTSGNFESFSAPKWTLNHTSRQLWQDGLLKERSQPNLSGKKNAGKPWPLEDWICP